MKKIAATTSQGRKKIFHSITCEILLDCIYLLINFRSTQHSFPLIFDNVAVAYLHNIIRQMIKKKFLNLFMPKLHTSNSVLFILALVLVDVKHLYNLIAERLCVCVLSHHPSKRTNDEEM